MAGGKQKRRERRVGPIIRESKKRARCAIAGGKSLPPEGDASAG